MTTLILVRHGQTDANYLNTYLGWSDAALNNCGVQQAKILADKLSSEKIDCVYSSPLKRALDTARHICSKQQVVLQVRDNLKEMNFGHWEGLTWEQVSEEYNEQYNKWCTDWINYTIPGGESVYEFYNRCIAEIDSIIRVNKHRKILIVTHHGCIRNILAYLIAGGINDLWKFKVAHGSMSRVEIVDGYPVLTQLNN